MQSELGLQLQGYRLTTAEINYYMPDYPRLLQVYVWQDYDLAPRFPILAGFLDHWRREIEAAIHSIRVAHRGIVAPVDWHVAGHVVTLN